MRSAAAADAPHRSINRLSEAVAALSHARVTEHLGVAESTTWGGMWKSSPADQMRQVVLFCLVCTEVEYSSRESEQGSTMTSNRHQHGLHQAATAIVVVGIGGKPEGQTEQGHHTGEEQQFSHGVCINAVNLAGLSVDGVANAADQASGARTSTTPARLSAPASRRVQRLAARRRSRVEIPTTLADPRNAPSHQLAWPLASWPCNRA